MQLGSVDPTGSYCAMPDDWIKKKLAEAAVRPTNDALFKSESIESSLECINLLNMFFFSSFSC